MACFITPMVTGIVTTVFRKKIPAALKISWLNIMLWGGVAMLVIEHIAQWRNRVVSTILDRNAEPSCYTRYGSRNSNRRWNNDNCYCSYMGYLGSNYIKSNTYVKAD